MLYFQPIKMLAFEGCLVRIVARCAGVASDQSNVCQRCDWIAEQARWRYLPARDYPLCPEREDIFGVLYAV